jgi:hypothetical protein
VQGARNRPAPPAVLVALLNVVRVGSPSTFGAVLEFRCGDLGAGGGAGVGWALATGAPATDRTGGERRAYRGHDLVPPIHPVYPLSRGSADWPLSPTCASGPVTSLSLPENISRNTLSGFTAVVGDVGRVLLSSQLRGERGN